MRYWLALFVSLPLFALELSVQSGKERGETFSILHLRNSAPFQCSATQNEYGQETQIVCRFPTAAKKTFEPISNPFLTVASSTTPQGYTITVTPKKRMRLFPMPFDLAKNSQTYRYNVASANHWMVVGYHETLPLIRQAGESAAAINFPVKINRNVNPYVGGLDLRGNPIKITQVQDVTDYMEMKKAYGAKDYDRVLELAVWALEHYPKSVFRNELMLYQIRALHEKEEYEKLLEVAKTFLRSYSSDPGVAEVLTYTANAYSKIGQNIDADYFYDRLFDEQADSPYASQGMVYKAQQLEISGSPAKAVQYYQKALASTKEIQTASVAAFRLAKIELERGGTKKASQYVDKIASANPAYFTEVRPDAVSMIQTFSDRNASATSARITEALMGGMDKKNPDHELLLRNLGLQLSQAGKRDEALKRFNEYLETYKYGEYAEEIRRAKDALFFVEGEGNATKEIKKYDDMIERYGNDRVGRKALYKKAQLLVREKRYKEVLDLESELYRLESVEFPETGLLITQSAIGLEKERLTEGKCAEALALQKMYKIKLLPEWDAKLYDCAIHNGAFGVAEKIVQPHLKSKSIPERQEWLYRMVQTRFGKGDYKAAIKGGEELATLIEDQKNPQLDGVYRVLFDAAQRSGDEMRMIRHIQSVERAFGNDFKDIERYTQMVSLGVKRRDEAMVQTYAKKAMDLQTRTKTYTQTPFIEFTLVQSYQNVGKDADALSVLKSLEGKKLTGEKRSRQNYLSGSIYMKLGRKDQARAAFDASIKADPGSAWGKLAKDALGLL